MEIEMNEETLRQLLQQLRSGQTDVEQVIARLRNLPFEQTDFATIDHHRQIRCGFPEVILCEGKTAAQIAAIFDKLVIDGIVNGIASISERFSVFSGKVDHRIVDGLVNGVADVTREFGDRVRRVQTGRIQNYLVFAVLGAIVLILVAR